MRHHAASLLQQAAVEAAVGPSPASQLRPPGVPEEGFIPFYCKCMVCECMVCQCTVISRAKPLLVLLCLEVCDGM